MNRWTAALFLIITSTTLQADDISDECLQSMQGVYKFYYHEILPKGNSATNQKLGPQEAEEMEMVIGRLKTSCSAETVAKMNQLLQAESIQQQSLS